MRLGHASASMRAQRPLIDSNGANTNYWTPSQARLGRSACLQSAADAGEHLGRPSYSVVHVTGYTKAWPPSAQPGQPGASVYEMEPAAATTFHLIAIARIQMSSAPTDLVTSSNGEFVSRHDQNGLVTFVDQRVAGLLGVAPADMLKKPLSDFLVPQDQQAFSDQLKSICETKQAQPVQMSLHFLNNGEVVPFSTSAYAFCNPCNDAFEFVVCTHTSQQYSEAKQHQPQHQQYTEPLNNAANPPQHLDANGFYGGAGMHASMGAGQYASGSYQHPHDQLSAYQGQFMQQQAGQQQFAQQPTAGAGGGSYANYLIMPSN